MNERQFLPDIDRMEKELGKLVADYGNKEISALYDNTQKKIAGEKLLSRSGTYDRIARICRSLIEEISKQEPTGKLSPTQKLDKLERDTFKLQLEKLEATALEGINILAKPVSPKSEAPKVKSESAPVPPPLPVDFATAFWDVLSTALDSAAEKLVGESSPSATRRPPPPTSAPASPKISRSASMEKTSEEKTVVSQEIFTEETKKTPPAKPKKAQKKKKSRLAVMEPEKTREEIDAERTAAKEKERSREAQVNIERQEMMKMLEKAKAQTEKRIAEVKVEPEEVQSVQAEPEAEPEQQEQRSPRKISEEETTYQAYRDQLVKLMQDETNKPEPDQSIVEELDNRLIKAEEQWLKEINHSERAQTEPTVTVSKEVSHEVTEVTPAVSLGDELEEYFESIKKSAEEPEDFSELQAEVKAARIEALKARLAEWQAEAKKDEPEETTEDKVLNILEAKGPEGLMKELQENESFREELLNVHPAMITYAITVVKDSLAENPEDEKLKEVSSYLNGLQFEVERQLEEEETTDDKFYKIYLNPKNGPENFARELKENKSFREEMVSRPDLMQKAVDYAEDDMQVLLDAMEKDPESHEDLLADIEGLHELALYLRSFLPQKETGEDRQPQVDRQFEEEMARSEVEVQPVAERSSVENLRESAQHFEKTLKQQKSAFLDAIDGQLMEKRAAVARAAGLKTAEIRTLEGVYEKNSEGSDLAKTAAKKWWDFPAIQAVSDFISTKIVGIPPLEERQNLLQQQLVSAKSAHDLGKALENPESSVLAIRVVAELDIGKFEVDAAAKKLFSTLKILDNVTSGIAMLKEHAPKVAERKQAEAPAKKHGLSGVVDRIQNKRQKTAMKSDSSRPHK